MRKSHRSNKSTNNSPARLRVYASPTRSSGSRRMSQTGGRGTCGFGKQEDGSINTLDRLAKFWYETKQMDVWWSPGQTGYYFSNRRGCTNCYQAPTHTHIYEIDDLDSDWDGMKNVKWATKRYNEKFEKGTIVMKFRKIVKWLEDMNNTIGTSNSCYDLAATT